MAEEVLSGRQIRARLVALLRETEGPLMSKHEVARRLGVHPTTIKRHWRPAFEEAERLRLEPIGPADIADIERALLAKAKEGSVQAARLLLLRKQLLNGASVPDDGARLVSEIKQIVEQHDGDEGEEEGGAGGQP